MLDLDEAVRKAASEIDWSGEGPAFVGFYCKIGTLDTTEVDLVKFIKKIDELSPRDNSEMIPMSEEEIANCIYENNPSDKNLDIIVNVHYRKDRFCQIVVRKEENRLVIHTPWYDHTDDKFMSILAEFGIKYYNEETHPVSCLCKVCLLFD